MTKLNQLIAILNGAKKRASSEISEIYKKVQKPALFSGSNRYYTPVLEEGFVYPCESQKVTLIAKDCIDEYIEAVGDFFDLAHTQDTANTQAVADVKVGEQVILRSVPITHLLFLEKQLQDVRTFISKLPTLPIDKDWRYDEVKRCYVTPERLTTKTKKTTDFVVVVNATKEFPAQVKETSVDINEGVWATCDYSGALSESEVKKLLKKVDNLLEAVIFARESANSIDVEISNKASKAIFGYLFG